MSSSQHKTNRARLGRLIIDEGTKTMRKFFDSIHPPHTLTAVLYSRYDELKRIKVINSTQMHKLFPPSGELPAKPSTSSDYDITLLFILIRNICGLHPPSSTGLWNENPPPGDDSPVADLVRLKIFRNEVSHISSNGVTNDDFNKYWTEISEVLVRLGADVGDIAKLKTSFPDEDLYISLLNESYENDEKTQFRISEMSLKLDEILTLVKSNMAAALTPPEVPPRDLDVHLQMSNHVKEIELRFRCSTGVLIVAGVTGLSIAAMYNKETLRPVIENVCGSVFGACKLALGSLVIDVHCSTAKRVKELIEAYRCGELKRRFLQELKKVGGSVEDLKIKFEVEETLELNKSLEQRILKQGEVKKTQQPEDGTTGMSNQEFIEILENIRKLGEVKNKINTDLEKKGLDLSLRDEDGRTFLHYAVLKQIDGLEYLFDVCATDIVDIQDCDGRTALHLACKHYYDSDSDIDIDSLIHFDSGYSEFSTASGYSEFSTASGYSEFSTGSLVSTYSGSNSKRIIRFLCKHGASINAKDSEGCTPLHYAAMTRNEHLVSFLISSGADISAIDENGKTPPHYAFERSNIRVIKLLLKHLASDKIDEKSVMMKNINVVDKEGKNILHYAAGKVSEPTIINKLLDIGLSVNAVDNDGMSALDHALASRNLENAVFIHSIMLEKNCPEHLFLGLWKKLKTQDSNGRTLLHYSVMHFKQNVLDILLERNVNLNYVDASGMSASHVAAKCGNVVALEKLVESGATVEGKDYTGRTVLHLAASHGDERMVDLLIKKNSNVNEIANKESTEVERQEIFAHEQPDVTEERNFARLIRLLIGVGADCLRNYFLKIHPTWSNQPSDASALKKGVLIIQKHQQAKYYAGDINEWDVSLLISVLRFSDLSSREVCRYPDIDNALRGIQQIRNTVIAHASDKKISAADFKTTWEKLESYLVAIGGSKDDIDATLTDYTERAVEQYWQFFLEKEVLQQIFSDHDR